MTDKIILAIDQGTTGSTVLAVSPELKVIGKANEEFEQVFPKPGWVEHQGASIWKSIEGATKRCLEQAGVGPEAIAGIGITNQRETTCLFDAKTSEPVHNFIVWQDRRTADVCKELKTQGHEALFKDRTGLVLDPYFSGTKIRWIFDHAEGVKAKAERGEVLFGTIDTWLVHKLTGGAAHITDATNASRTLLMDLAKVAWDEELMGILGVPAACLPTIKSSSEVYGETQGVGFLPDGIPVAGVVGDQQAALFGQACFEKGMAKCTYGTGTFLVLNTGTEVPRSDNGLLSTVAIKLGDTTTYALEGSSFIAGAAVQWLRDMLGIIESAPDIEPLAKTVESSGEVCFVPALAGLGAPHWRADARGLLCGLSRDSNKGHIARAVLEGIAMQQRDILEAMKADGAPLAELRVDGGAAANDTLMQFQADVLGVNCVRPDVLETTALGAAALAGLAVGVFTDKDEVTQVWRAERVFEPSMPDEERQRHVDKWARAVERA
jgi:glycerol kinase